MQDEALARLEHLKIRGSLLARPYADTLQGSKLANLKELRFSHNGAPIRILFAFDPRKQGVIILAGDRTGNSRWYKTSIPLAEKFYAIHIEKQQKEDEEKVKEARKKKEKDR
ncbi:MAG: type II toxin-antitoxin system RelE/ParE family toxin [Candidatus Obscuribacterales bacterium]|nr:type II toxin-antitoxin system RelE/ParE family toxin [Candidatus Obscuribacterales bacterium]